MVESIGSANVRTVPSDKNNGMNVPGALISTGVGASLGYGATYISSVQENANKATKELEQTKDSFIKTGLELKKNETKADPKAAEKATPEAEVKVDPKAAKKAAPKSEAKVDPKAAKKAAPKSKAKVDPKAAKKGKVSKPIIDIKKAKVELAAQFEKVKKTATEVLEHSKSATMKYTAAGAALGLAAYAGIKALSGEKDKEVN